MRIQHKLMCSLQVVSCLALVVISDVTCAEPQDVPPVTETERATLVRDKSLLELQIDVAKKRAELTKLELPVDHAPVAEVIPEEKVILVGVRGIDGRLTADLRVGGMPLTLKAGEEYGDLKLKNITATCATIIHSGVVKKRCLTVLPQTPSVTQRAPNAPMGGGMPLPGTPPQQPYGN